MDFLGVGGWEVLLILVIAVIVMGPGRMAEIGRTLGKTVRALKKATFDLTTQVTRELEEQEKGSPTRQPSGDQPSGKSGTIRNEQ